MLILPCLLRRAALRCVCLSIVVGMIAIGPIHPRSASALENGLARTPYMGWNSYYGLTPMDERTITEVADALVGRGLLRAGYQYLWLDVSWWDGTRDSMGNIVPPQQLWPHGLLYLTNYIHARGLRAGIYTDAGADGCGGAHQGSGPVTPGGADHYQQDADQFGAWGFDALKVDFCGGLAAGLDPATQYARFRDALSHNAAHRALLYNICNPFSPFNENPPLQQSAYWSPSYGPGTGNSWRTETDVALPWRPAPFRWPDVLRNLSSDAAHPEAAGPGHWNDPDYLGPENGMTPTEDQAQFSMWAIVAAPLMIGSDVRKLSDSAVAMLTNPEVIAIDQDPWGWQGIKIADSDGVQVWMRYLAGSGTRAVALLNTRSDAAQIDVDWQILALSGPASVRDVWQHTDLGSFDDRYGALVPGHGAALLVVNGTDRR